MADPVVIQIAANAQAFKDTLDSVIGKVADFRSVLGTIGGIAVFGALLDGLKDCVEAFADNERAMLRTQSVLTSTGGAAGVTSNAVEELAASLSRQTSIQKDVVIGAEDVLLSFTRIGNEIFPQATKAALDLSFSMGTSASEAANVLGRALQDPITGVARLTRAHVQFSDALKGQITALVESGQLQAAQALILDRVAHSTMDAKTNSEGLIGTWNTLKTTTHNIAEAIGGTLVSTFKLLTQETANTAKNAEYDAQTSAGKLKAIQQKQHEESMAENKAFTIQSNADATKAEIDKGTIRKMGEAIQIAELQGADKAVISLMKQQLSEEKNLLDAKYVGDKTALRAQLVQTNAALTEAHQNQAVEQQIFNDQLQKIAQTDDQKDIARDTTHKKALEAQLRGSILTRSQATQQYLANEMKLKIDNDNTYLIEEQKFGSAIASIKQIQRTEEYQNMSKGLSDLQQLSNSHNETMKAIGKAASVAQIVMKTAEGAINAFNAFSFIPFVGPTLGYAAAAAIIAYGAEQEATALGANQGGVYNTGGTKGLDSIPALYTPGELVVPDKNFDEVVNSVADQRNQQADNQANNSPYNNAQGGGGSQQVTVQIAFSGNASQLLTALQIQDKKLGLSRATA